MGVRDADQLQALVESQQEQLEQMHAAMRQVQSKIESQAKLIEQRLLGGLRSIATCAAGRVLPEDILAAAEQLCDTGEASGPLVVHGQDS